MRILLDECVNPRLKWAFPQHQVRTVIEMGWSGITNGKLLALAQRDFDVLVTLDRNMEHQQNLSVFTLGVVVVVVPDNNIKYYRPIFAELAKAVRSASAGQVIRVISPDIAS